MSEAAAYYSNLVREHQAELQRLKTVADNMRATMEKSRTLIGETHKYLRRLSAYEICEHTPEP